MNKEKLLKYLIENTCNCVMSCSSCDNYYEIIELIRNGVFDNE